MNVKIPVFVTRVEVIIYFLLNNLNDCAFKACVRYFLSNFYFSQNDSPLETMKNVFYFI